MKQLVSSNNGSPPIGPFSPGLVVDGWVFLSGQGGLDPVSNLVASSDIEAQTEQTFRNIEALLEAAGCGLEDVVSCLVHLSDLADFQAFNAAYERHFQDPKPVRTTTRADLVAGMKVEITITARTDRGPEQEAAR